MKYRYIDNLTLEEIATRYKVTKPNIRQFIEQSLRRLRCNTKTRRLGIELGVWEKDKPFNIERVKERIEQGQISWLGENELRYAVRMGWINKDMLQGN